MSTAVPPGGPTVKVSSGSAAGPISVRDVILEVMPPGVPSGTSPPELRLTLTVTTPIGGAGSAGGTFVRATRM